MPKFLIICRRSSPLALQASQDVFKDDVTVKHYAVPGKIGILRIPRIPAPSTVEYPYRRWCGMVPTFIRVYGFVWNIIF